MTSADLKFTLLAMLPTGDVHQVVMSSDEIKLAIGQRLNGKIKLVDPKLSIEWTKEDYKSCKDTFRKKDGPCRYELGSCDDCKNVILGRNWGA